MSGIVLIERIATRVQHMHLAHQRQAKIAALDTVEILLKAKSKAIAADWVKNVVRIRKI